MVNFGRDEGACHAGITRRAFLAEEALGGRPSGAAGAQCGIWLEQKKQVKSPKCRKKNGK